MQHPGSWFLLIFVCLCIAAILTVLHLTSLGRLIHQQIPDRPQRRLFLASISFFVTFVAVRLLVFCITNNIGPFGWVQMGGVHIHHLVWGIFILLLCGYGELTEVADRDTPVSILLSRVLALGYGAGAALTLDEFAIWLNLNAADYWGAKNRESIDAVILFGALLAIGSWGAPVFRSIFRRGTR